VVSHSFEFDQSRDVEAVLSLFRAGAVVIDEAANGAVGGTSRRWET
jgi:hypothetical protein